MQDIAAPLYAQLLADAAQRLGPSPAFYSLWPVSEPSAPWATVAARLFAEVSRKCKHTFLEYWHDCLCCLGSSVSAALCSHCNNPPGEMNQLASEACCVTTYSNDSEKRLLRTLLLQVADLPVVHIERSGGQWIRAGEAMFLDPSNKAQPELLEALLREGIPLVCHWSLNISLPVMHAHRVCLSSSSHHSRRCNCFASPTDIIKQAFASCLRRLGRACLPSCWRPACSACLARRS